MVSKNYNRRQAQAIIFVAQTKELEIDVKEFGFKDIHRIEGFKLRLMDLEEKQRRLDISGLHEDFLQKLEWNACRRLLQDLRKQLLLIKKP